MQSFLALLAVLLFGAVARAQELQPIIARSLTVPAGRVEITVHGTYTNWTGLGTTSLEGETLAMGADFGVTDRVQLGLAVALPINPGAGFGTVLGSAALGVSKTSALRLDVGFESFGINGNNTLSQHINRYFGGLGVPTKLPITSTLAFVSGRTGAVQFGHFNNLGSSGTGLYIGATDFTEIASDLLVVSAGDNNSSTHLGINLPFGLLVQPDPHFAVTLQAGYSTVIDIPTGPGSDTALHFVPIGVDAVVTPSPPLDLGVRFFVDGYVAQTGGSSAGAPRYLDFRELMFWMRVRT